MANVSPKIGPRKTCCAVKAAKKAKDAVALADALRKADTRRQLLIAQEAVAAAEGDQTMLGSKCQGALVLV